MDIDLLRWVGKYEEQWKGKPIEYKNISGEWKTDNDPLFGSISTAIQSRGKVSVDELRKISQWKLQGRRNDSNINQNNASDVEQQSQTALQASGDAEAIDVLTQLSGVGVPVASTVLTVAEPSQYAIIDYRSFRGLGAAKPQIVEPVEYATYAKFLEYFRTYLTKSEAYEFYMIYVREIAEAEGLSARHVDMALWALDKESV